MLCEQKILHIAECTVVSWLWMLFALSVAYTSAAVELELLTCSDTVHHILPVLTDRRLLSGC